MTDAGNDAKELRPPVPAGNTAEPEPSSGDGTSIATSLAPEKKAPSHQKRRFIAVSLSALVPGTGQLFLRQRLKGTVLLGLFATVVLCFWPLRVPTWWEAFTLVLAVWIGLSWYSVGAALLARDSANGKRPSMRWLLLVPALSWIGVNLVWTPVFWAAGFRTEKFLGSSMEPTLFDHDYLIVDKHYYRHSVVQRNDLVEFLRNDSLWMKRVIAISGDTIEGRDGRVLLNGQALDEPFIKRSGGPDDPTLATFGPVSVPPGKYFVMGDNRDFSFDSRSFGVVDGKAITAKPLYVYRTRGKGWLMRRNIQ